MGNRYIVSKDNVTPTGGSDLVTLISASGRRIRLVEFSVNGRGTTSAAQQVLIGRSSGGTTSGGAITPGKVDHTDEPTAAFTAPTTWSAQPTFNTDNFEAVGWNALGGANRWIPPKGSALEARGAATPEQISIRAPSGPTYQACSWSAIVEED